MCDVELEKRKLVEECAAARLYYTAQQVFRMNEVLKCSICFEIFRQATLVTSCAHTFCEDCIHVYLATSENKEPPCPVCQKPMRNRFLRPADFQAKAANLAFIHAKLNTLSESNGRKSPSLLTILTSVKETTTTNIPVPNKNLVTELDDGFVHIQKARKILLKSKNNHKLPPVQTVPVKDGSTPLRTNFQTTATALTKSKQPDTSEDSFYCLRKSPAENPVFSRVVTRKYKSQKQPNKHKSNVQETTRVEESGDNSKKADTVRWLHDNRNNFDCRPQTQENLVPELASQELDMPSISQMHRRPHNPIPAGHLSKQKQEVQKIRQKSKTVTCLTRVQTKPKASRHTQSLHCDMKAKEPNLRRKVNSWASCVETAPNAVFEQAKRDEDVVKSAIVDMIEEKYLKSIESEVLGVNKSEAEASHQVRGVEPKKSKRIMERLSKGLPARGKTKTNLSSGWTRMKETKKTLRKTERRATKLTLESRCTGFSTRSKSNRASSQTPNKGKEKKKLQPQLQAVVDVKKRNASMLPKVKTISDIKPTPRPYYLEQQEIFFQNFNKTEIVTESKKTPEKQSASNKEQPLSNLEKKSCSNQLVFDADDQNTRSIATERTNKGKVTKELLPQLLLPVVVVKRLNLSKFASNVRPINDNETATEVFMNLNKTQNVSVSKKTSEAEFTPNSPNTDQRNLDNQDQYIKSNATQEVSSPPTLPKLHLPPSKLSRLDDKQQCLKPSPTTEIQNEISQAENTSLSQPLKLALPNFRVQKAPELNTDLKLSEQIPPSTVIQIEDNPPQSKINPLFEDQLLKLMDIDPTTSSNLFDSCSTKYQNKGSCDSDNDVFIHPTQPIVTNSNERQENSEEEDIFSKPTQPITLISEQQKYQSQQDKSGETNLNHKIDIVKETLNTFQTLPIKTNETVFNFIAKVETLLKDIGQNYTKANKLTKDADIQTDGVKDQSSYLSSNATTQTVLPEAKSRHAAIQTDTCESSGGFRISATSMFKTQPTNNAHMQTDPLCCPECKYVYPDLDSNLKQTFSNRVLDNSQLIKTLTDKYKLSSSLDGIDFETQEIIKGREIRGSGSSSKSLQIDQNSSLGVKGEIREINNLGEPQKTQPNNVDSVLHESKLQLKKTFKRIRKPSSDSDPDCEVELQEVKKNKFMQDDLSLHFASEEQGELIPVIDKEMVEQLPDTSFGSEDFEFYEACLKTVLKSCDRLSSSRSTKTLPAPEHPAKRRKTQDMIRECENIIREACSESIRIERTQNYSSNLPDSVNPAPSKLTLAAMEEEFQNTFGGEVSGVGNVHKGGEISCGGENRPLDRKYTQARNKFSESLFTNSNGCTNNGFAEKMKAASNNDSEYGADPEPAPTTVPTCQSTEAFVIQPVDHSNRGGKIKILQDKVIVNTNGRLNQSTDLTEVATNSQEENDSVSQKSNDLFLSDMDGIVETTPQKSRPTTLERLSELSQAYYNPRASQILPEEVDESPDVISFIDPPSPFGRKTKTNNVQEKTNINQNRPPTSSLTPDLDLSRTSQCLRDRFQTSTPFRRSQITPPRSLMLSPITTAKDVNRKINPIIAAQHSKYSPLTVVKSNTPPPQQPSCSSTAKQKSILSYIGRATNLNSGRVKNNSHGRSLTETQQIVNKKPVVSFTRLCQEKVQAIVTLSIKKLINFTDVLDTSVTHLILEVDDENRVVENTIKYLTAVASGIWVLHFGWIMECLNQNRIVPEEPFEALDLSGEAGPKKARLSKLERPLLSGYKFYVYLPSLKGTDHEKLQHVLTLLGGEVVLKAKDLVDDGKVRLIISDPGCTQETEIYDFWLEKLHVVTVAVDWLTETVGQYQIASLLSFTECSKKTICDLGYPPELTATISSDDSELGL